MKRIRRMLCVACAAMLAVSLAACASVDDEYRQGKAYLQSGEFLKAYESFRASSADEAMTELTKFEFVPLVQTSTSSFGKLGRQQYTYDTSGNLTRIDATFEGTKYATVYAYDENDRLVETKAKNSVSTYTYDDAGRRRTFVKVTEAGTYKEEYLYDESGNHIKTLVTYENGMKTTVTPQEIETQNGSGLAEYTYDDAGRVIAETYPNGEKHTYTYDAYGNKTGEKYTWGETFTEYKYTWAIYYYPNGISGPAKDLRDRVKQKQPVM